MIRGSCKENAQTGTDHSLDEVVLRALRITVAGAVLGSSLIVRASIAGRAHLREVERAVDTAAEGRHVHVVRDLAVQERVRLVRVLVLEEIATGRGRGRAVVREEVERDGVALDGDAHARVVADALDSTVGRAGGGVRAVSRVGDGARVVAADVVSPAVGRVEDDGGVHGLAAMRTRALLGRKVGVDLRRVGADLLG
jgi:hypothetical protein